MFTTLLMVTFAIAVVMATLVVLLFRKPVFKILSRLVTEELAPTWQRYILFATYVVGISGGVPLWDIEKYVTPDREGVLLQLTPDRWIIEIYKSVIGSLQSIAWMLLIFFLFALIAYVVVRGFEAKRGGGKENH
ncbi:MAG: hypothetical protein F9K22_10305 [Bacteroidetes bacterium]|nr:MAG: hypothetical protein F9K22_10305 [Bacteroidota bacterium]